jgi:hypothetical protein
MSQFPKNRPQDPMFDLAGFTFESLEHGGTEPDSMPIVIRVTDREGRSAIYAAIAERPLV